jgi:hypothetical protein
MEDLLQGNNTINQPNHNAYTWRRAKEYKFTTKISHFFEELKVQSRTKIDNQRSAKFRILLAKKIVLKIILKSIYTPSQKKTLVFLMSHI